MGSLKEIAHEAGVSLSTVSRALRGSEAISEATRRRIVGIAERLNYLPNRAAQILVDRKSGTPAVSTLIGVVYGAEIAPNDYYYSTVTKSIVDEAALDGFSTFISPVAGGYDGLMSFARRLRNLHTTGLVLVGNIAEQSVTALRAWSPNIVVVDKPSTELTCVYNDNERGAFDAVSFLTRAGCRRIAFIRGTSGHYFTQATQRGYERALREAGVAVDESLCAEGEFHVRSGYEAMRRILARAGRPDAVFSNDEMAVGALRALKEEGVRVPDEAMVFGFDNLALAEIVDPPLSTVRVDFEYMARTAVRKLIENSRSERIVPVDIVIPVELVIRETTRRNR